MPPLSTLVAVLSVANFVIGMGAFMVIGLIEPVASDFNTSPGAAGAMLTSYAMGYAVLSPLLVALTGRIGRRRVLALGMLVFALAAVFSALAPSMAWMSAARVIAAGGAGLVTPVAAAVAAGLAPPEGRAKVLAAVFFGLTLAQVMGVPAGSWLAYTFGWQVAFWVVVVLAIPSIALIWIKVPAGLTFQPVTLSDLGGVLRDARMMLAVFFTASFLAAIYVVFTYLAPLLSVTMGFGRDGITLTLLLSGIGAVAGNLLGGWMSDRYGPGLTLTGLAISQTVLMPVYSYLPIPMMVFFVLAVVWPMCGWSFMAGQQARLIAASGPRAPVVLALNAAAIYVGAAVGSTIGGVVLDALGPTALGWAGSCCAVLALVHLRLSLWAAPTGR